MVYYDLKYVQGECHNSMMLGDNGYISVLQYIRESTVLIEKFNRMGLFASRIQIQIHDEFWAGLHKSV